MNAKIEKLPSPVHHGDWHDKPAKWEVTVHHRPELRQQFATRKDARVWSGLVRNASPTATFNELCHAYLAV